MVFPLARKVLFDIMKLDINDTLSGEEKTVGEELLTPTKIYVKPVLEALKKFPIKGMAHITGGGLIENIPRVLPPGVDVKLDKSSWESPSIFKVIKDGGNIDEEEMCRVFNNGIGFTVFCTKENSEGILSSLKESGEEASVIGEVLSSNEKNGKVIFK